MEKLNSDFIRRATHVRFLNFENRDFLTTEYKNEIQYLIKLHYFANFDLKNTLDRLDKNNYNRAVKMLKQENANQFKILHNSKMEGLGPSEIVMYFLLNNARLGGSSSGGVDIIDGSNKYEVKAVEVTSKNQASNFMLGKARLTHIQYALSELRQKYRIPGTDAELPKTSIDKLKQVATSEFNTIENAYRAAVLDYFKSTPVVFISNRNKDLGEILDIKKVKSEEISIERITRNTVKPYIQL
jgi:hypothetical protein